MAGRFGPVLGITTFFLRADRDAPRRLPPSSGSRPVFERAARLLPLDLHLVDFSPCRARTHGASIFRLLCRADSQACCISDGAAVSAGFRSRSGTGKFSKTISSERDTESRRSSCWDEGS